MKRLLVTILLMVAVVFTARADNSQRINELQSMITQIQAQRYTRSEASRDNLNQIVGGISELTRLDRLERERITKEEQEAEEAKEAEEEAKKETKEEKDESKSSD